MTTAQLQNIHPVVAQVTRRISERSQPLRDAYLARLEQMRGRGPRRASLSCANQAHANAAAESRSKIWLNQAQRPNIGIVTAYNDMLSAHQPYERFPELIRQSARAAGAVAQAGKESGTLQLRNELTVGRGTRSRQGKKRALS